ASYRVLFIATCLINCKRNVVMLSGAMFMLEVYELLLPSRSGPTPIGNAVLAGGRYIAEVPNYLILSFMFVTIGTSTTEGSCGAGRSGQRARIRQDLAPADEGGTGQRRSPAAA